MEAKKIKSIYNSVGEWAKADPNAYQYAYNHGYLPKICEDCGWKPPIISKPNGYWGIKENVIEEAKKFKTQKEWKEKSGRSYESAQINGWMPECIVHMIKIKKPNGHWTKERCIAMALTCESIKEWKEKSNGSYNSAHRNGWQPECTKHMM